MTGRQHLIIGGAWALSAASLAAPVAGPVGGLVIIGAGLVGCLVPDLDGDHATLVSVSRAGARSSPLWWPSAAIVWLAHTLLRPLPHRGITHGIPVASALCVALSPLWWPAALGLWVGWVSHIVADWTTVQGVGLLTPFDHRRYRCPLVRVRGGSLASWVMTLVLVAVPVVVLWLSRVR